MNQRHELRWYSPYGDDPIIFDSGRLPYVLRKLSGFSQTLTGAIATKSPRQSGRTALNTSVGSRVLSIESVLTAENYDEYWDRRAKLIASLVSSPVSPGVPPEQGLLRFRRSEGHPEVQLRAIPIESPQEGARLDRFSVVMDVEWEAAQPYWEETSDRFYLFASEGQGFTFPLTHPWMSESADLTQTIFNPGHLPSPIVARIYGPGTTGRLIHLDQNETIEVTGSIATGEYVEIETSFGQKRVELVDESTGARTNIMDRVNFDLTNFWSLLKGSQSVRFEMDENIDAYAQIAFRARYGGV